MKNYKDKKWIIRCFMLALIFIGYNTTMNVLDQMIEKAKKDKTVNADVIITMQDLGFETHKTITSYVERIDDVEDNNALKYKLQIDNDNVNNEVTLNFTFYRFSNNDITNTVYKLAVPHVYNNYNDIFGNKVNLDLSKNDYNTQIKKMVQLDTKSWNVENACAIYEPFTEYLNSYVLQKDNKILLMTIYGDKTLNNNHIEILSRLIDDVDAIFDSYGKE